MFKLVEKKSSEVILTAGQRQVIAVKEMIAYYMESKVVCADFAITEQDFTPLLDPEYRHQLYQYLIEDKQILEQLIKYAFGEWPVFRRFGFVTAQSTVAVLKKALRSIEALKDAPLESKTGLNVIRCLVAYKYCVATLIKNKCKFWDLSDEPDYQIYLEYLDQYIFENSKTIEARWSHAG